MIEEYREIKAWLMANIIGLAIGQEIQTTGLEKPSYKIEKRSLNTYKDKEKKLVKEDYNTVKRGGARI